MADQDRLYVDYNKKDFIRDLNNKGSFLRFDNMKDLFIYAMSLGLAYPKSIVGKKEAVFLDKDLNSEDKALLYSMIRSDLNNIDDLIDKNIVYDIAQNMANMGFCVIKETLDNSSIENINKKLLVGLDEKFKEIASVL